jgi:glucose-6-phosphate 1-dehydrogenase
VHIEQCYRSQYEGYRQELGINPESDTETYAELKLAINNSRWAGVPIYLRTGKALNRSGTEIGVRFKKLPGMVFEGQNPQQNTIVFLIQPQAGILVGMASKEPGNEMILTNTSMTFCYLGSFDQEIPEAYQRLLLDAVHGDHTLFVDAHETELAWQILEPVLDTGALSFYPQGIQPASHFNVGWIDFEQYHVTCSQGTTEKQL